ncbi:MAG: hypothetical protein PHS95_01715 [Candidatus Pacebacteria bacterium]|nr:hypothetical protein [Candidatus Paceibacterota bacterium]
MKILSVSPIVRGVLRDTLTYFSKETVPVGALIEVPILSREVPALVLEVKDATTIKSTIKSSDYAMRKITRVRARYVWNDAFLKATEETARYGAQALGETLLALTPKAILDAHISGQLQNVERKASPGKKFRLLAIQNDTKTRLESYQRLVRESFVKEESVFISAPTVDDVERLARELGHGIPEFTFSFHSGTGKKKMLERWSKAIKEKHAILVVGTPQYLSLPRKFKTIVLDEENSRSWKTLLRPLIDTRIFAESYARYTGSTLIFGASILRPEIHKRIEAGEIEEWHRVARRVLSPVITTIVDPREEEKYIKETMGRRTFQVLSEKIREQIGQAVASGERIVLISARKGLAPLVACGDCGAILRCKNCENPLVLHKRDSNTRVFSCHACGLVRVPEASEHETCPECGGWRLEGLGIGTERINEEVFKYFPKAPCFIFDGDRVTTHTEAKKLVTQFEKSEGGILIGTPMAIPYLNTTEYASIVSIDSLFSIPDFRMNERVFALILGLREKVTKTLLIQTRANDTTFFKQIALGDLASFTKSELAIRKSFSYPPYGTMIKITLRGRKNEIPFEMERLRNFLVEYAPLPPQTMSREPKKVFRMHTIIKLKENVWIDEKLLVKLRALPRQFTVEVNPSHLL